MLFALLATSCGGGGSGGGGDTPDNPPPPPPPQYSEVTSGSGLEYAVSYTEVPNDNYSHHVSFMVGGAAAGDFDADGDIDLFVVRGDIGPNLLYRNDGDNSFTNVAAQAGLAYTKSATENYRLSGPVFADMDGDGDLDLYVGGVQDDPSFIFSNNGDGTFSDVTATSGIDGLGALHNVSGAFGDYDLDGDLDLLISHWGTPRSRTDPGDTEHLWRNISTASEIRFESVSVEAEISPSILTLPDPNAAVGDTDFTLSPSFAHLNDDLYPDILMAADFDTTMVFMNDGDGTFTNVTDVEVIRDTNGMGSALADYDNDGDLDWFVTSIYRAGTSQDPNGNVLYRNDDGVFVDATGGTGVEDGSWGWGACWVDFENDGDLDIYHTNGWDEDELFKWEQDSGRAFVNNGNARFLDEAEELGLFEEDQGRGVVCADFDNDGDTDIFLWISNDTVGARFFRNDSTENNYLRVRLNGLPPNTAAIGARIRVQTDSNTLMREVSLNSNFVTHNPAQQVFGLGTAGQADSVIVEWPDGQVTDLGTRAANQDLVVDHPAL